MLQLAFPFTLAHTAFTASFDADFQPSVLNL
jgi:hypothetical protein